MKASTSILKSLGGTKNIQQSIGAFCIRPSFHVWDSDMKEYLLSKGIPLKYNNCLYFSIQRSTDGWMRISSERRRVSNWYHIFRVIIKEQEQEQGRYSIEFKVKKNGSYKEMSVFEQKKEYGIALNTYNQSFKGVKLYLEETFHVCF